MAEVHFCELFLKNNFQSKDMLNSKYSSSRINDFSFIKWSYNRKFGHFKSLYHSLKRRVHFLDHHKEQFFALNDDLHRLKIKHFSFPLPNHFFVIAKSDPTAQLIVNEMDKAASRGQFYA